MELNKQIDAIYQALLEQAMRVRALLLHPRSKYRSLLLAMLINDPKVTAYYYALGPDDTNLRSFVEGLSHEMSNQQPTFGRHLNMLDDGVYENMQQNFDLVLEKFLDELRELSDDPFILVLDEYDRSDNADDIHRFVEHLVDNLPANCHLVVNSRSLPRLPWVSMVAKKQAALMLDDHLVEENFYNNRKEGAYDLEVFALGQGIVLHQGKPIESWEGHLPRLLFFFALDKPLVTRSEICKAFWPDLATDQAVNVFHVTKRRLHKALGFDVLVHQDSHYQINPELNVYYDVLDFVETLVKGRNPNNPNPFDAWQHAVELYRGPFLQGHGDGWIAERREAFRHGYLEALSEMAQVWVERDRKEQALKLYRQALEEDNSREELHVSLMQLYNELGRRSEAVSHYQEMLAAFDELGLDVSEDTEAFYAEISED